MTVLELILGNVAIILPLFLWIRSESRADIRHMDIKLEEFRRETNEILKAIQTEMKDFHNRLCKIEQERK